MPTSSPVAVAEFQIPTHDAKRGNVEIAGWLHHLRPHTTIMKLQTDLVNRFKSADRRFDRFTENFTAFTMALDYFADAQCPVRGVKITKSDDPHSFAVTYRTVTIDIRMLCELSDTGTAIARVICTLARPSFSLERKVLGSFSFDGQGITDHEVDEGDDPVGMDDMAHEIVLSFVQLALQHRTG